MIVVMPEMESICGLYIINISKWLNWLVVNGRTNIFSDFYESIQLFCTITSCSDEGPFS
jgi:hypothetical protein